MLSYRRKTKYEVGVTANICMRCGNISCCCWLAMCLKDALQMSTYGVCTRLETVRVNIEDQLSSESTVSRGSIYRGELKCKWEPYLLYCSISHAFSIFFNLSGECYLTIEFKVFFQMIHKRILLVKFCKTVKKLLKLILLLPICQDFSTPKQHPESHVFFTIFFQV